MSLAFDPLKQHMKIWVCWAPPNKQPLQPDGAPAKSNDPSTWHTFDECIASGMGLGCMITEPYVGVDLDDCRDTGTGIIAPWAVALIAAARSYTEISPSGTGVHIWHWRKPGPATKSVKKNGVEIYFESRYFTHTGNQVAGTPDSFSEYDPAVYSARLGSPGVLEVTAVQPIPDGMRNETLFKRGCGMRAQGQNYESIYSGLQDINKFCNPPKPDFEVQTIARSAMRYEPSTALAIFKQMSSNGENNKKLVGRWGCDIKPEALVYAWDPVLPQAALTHFGGASNNGKSPVTVDLAARITRGAAWPCGAPNLAGPQRVIMLNVEDRAEDTIIPRFTLAGGDLKMLYILDGTTFDDNAGNSLERMVALDKDIGELAKLARGMNNLGMMTIDPITNYLGAAEMNKEAEIRRVLTPVAKLAQELRIPIISVGHFNKGDSKDPLQRMMGASAFIGVARAVWAFGQDPNGETPYYRIMAPARGNIGHQAMKYHTTVNDERTVRIVWDGWGEGSAEDTVTHMTRYEKGTDKHTAEELKDLLEDGPKTARECVELIERCGGNESRVKKIAGIECYKSNKDRLWRLRGQSVQLDLEAHVDKF